jgi:hypothetical protein
LPHLNVRPPATSGCSDLPDIELAGNRVVAGMTGRLYLSN